MRHTLIPFHFRGSPGIWGVTAAFLAAASAASATVIVGDPADYESRRQQIEGGFPTVSTGAGDAEEVRVFAEAVDGFLLNEGRPIFQFDLAELAEPPAAATFSVELLSSESNLPFAIELWGTDFTAEGPMSEGDPGAAGQFASSNYEPARMGGGLLLDDGSEPGTVQADITDYLTARYDDYLLGGDSWVFLRLQPESSWSADDGIEADFAFASADHATEALRPRIETVPIPEPATTGWVIAAAAGALLTVRGRGFRLSDSYRRWRSAKSR